MLKNLLIILWITNLCWTNKQEEKSEENARIFMENLNKEYALRLNKVVIASWNYATNITQENLDASAAVSSENAKWIKEEWKNVVSYPWRNYNEDLRRQFKQFALINEAALDKEKFEKLTKSFGKMKSIYSTAKICSFHDKNKCDLSLEPDLENILKNSEDPEELKHVWVEWRNASGKQVRKFYPEIVEYLNEAAKLNNFKDASEMWLSPYEDPNFKDEVNKLWLQLQPLYLQIHSYVRYKLKEKYGDIVPEHGLIPAHLLGNMWSQTWGNIYKHMVPYPEAKNVDVTEEMIAQGYTPLKILKMAEEFFTSINMSAMPQEFWDHSVIVKPKDRNIICHASAWDFYDQKNFRIKQCTVVEQRNFHTVHHEMGHIQYYLQYKNQPAVFRKGANPGFHEAVGDVISLSVSTDKHLHKVGLLKNLTDNYEATINKLFEIGLNKIAFLPYAYILDLWRWNIYKGRITSKNYNSEWWKLRNEIQGVQAPVIRDENDFDPGAKYHVVGNVPYIRYFVSYVIQFQFHKALCEKAGEYQPNNPKKPLYKCDIYKSAKAGNALAEMLQMGSSKPWQDAMESLTGSRVMDASALLEYFSPLQEWLINENKKNGQLVGWKD